MSDKYFNRICYGIVLFLVLTSILPFIYILFISLSAGASIASGNIFSFNNELSLTSYISLFKYANLGNSLLNSVILSLVGTTLNMLFTIPCSYSLSRPDMCGKKFIYGFLIFAMFFRGELIPTYVWMSKLGLLDTYFAVWCHKLVSIYNIFILSSFFENLPLDVINAAKLDGAGPLTILWKIVIPMSKTAIISIVILYLASWWNDYYMTMVYIRDPDKYTLPLRIVQMVTNIEDSSVYLSKDLAYSRLSAYGIRAAGIIISMIPMLIVVPILQKSYISGLLKNKMKDMRG